MPFMREDWRSTPGNCKLPNCLMTFIASLHGIQLAEVWPKFPSVFYADSQFCMPPEPWNTGQQLADILSNHTAATLPMFYGRTLDTMYDCTNNKERGWTRDRNTSCIHPLLTNRYGLRGEVDLLLRTIQDATAVVNPWHRVYKVAAEDAGNASPLRCRHVETPPTIVTTLRCTCLLVDVV